MAQKIHCIINLPAGEEIDKGRLVFLDNNKVYEFYSGPLFFKPFGKKDIEDYKSAVKHHKI